MLLDRPISVKYILNTIKFDMLYVLIISLVVYFLTLRIGRVFPEISLVIPTFIGTSISILLSFKLNHSYERWWEARKIWGAIVNDSRSLVLQLQGMVAEGNEAVVKKMAHRQIGWCYCLGQSLRNSDPVANLESFIPKEELDSVQSHQNVPLALLQLHTLDLAELRQTNRLDVFGHVQLGNTLARLTDSMGKAERIKSTIFPVTYRLFLHLLIYVFVITLTISLSAVGQFRATLLLILSAAFFLLEKTATHMQDPFDNKPTDTAVTAIARTIEINLKQLLKETDIPPAQQPTGFYLS